MIIANECVVSIHYTLTNDAGETLDSSSGGEPLSYLHGASGLIPGLERELEGREAGDAFVAVVQPEDAYGVPDPELLHEVPRSALGEIENLSVGMRLQARGQDGSIEIFVVESLREDTAILNANHILAGEVLHFDVTVDTVRSATAEEVAEGRPL